jgi:hypothetical protein
MRLQQVAKIISLDKIGHHGKMGPTEQAAERACPQLASKFRDSKGEQNED